MPSKNQTQQWQIYNPLDKASRPPEIATSKKLPYSKSSSVKDTLQRSKVCSVGVAPPRNSMEVKDLNVMLIGNCIAEQSQTQGGDVGKKVKKETDIDGNIPEKNLDKKRKMPAIISSEGTTTKPSYAQRAKPPSMPRSKVIHTKKTRSFIPQQNSTIHLTTPNLEEDREITSSMSKGICETSIFVLMTFLATCNAAMPHCMKTHYYMLNDYQL